MSDRFNDGFGADGQPPQTPPGQIVPLHKPTQPGYAHQPPPQAYPALPVHPPQAGYVPPGHGPHPYPSAAHPPAAYPPAPYAPVLPWKDTSVAYLLWFFLGGFGAHQFYLGRPGWGAAYLVLLLVGWLTSVLIVGLFLLGALVILLIVDLFLIPSLVRDANARMAGLRPY